MVFPIRKLHITEDHGCLKDACNICIDFIRHSNHDAQCKLALLNGYQLLKDNDYMVSTVDLQKSLMMPKATIKECYFSRKLVLVNLAPSDLGNYLKA